MDNSLTPKLARARIAQLLDDTLRPLPSGISLSNQSDLDGVSTQDGYDLIPTCTLEGPPPHPRQVSVSYWVNGMPKEQIDVIFHAINRAWSDKGWSLEANKPTLSVAHTSDSYDLTARIGQTGTGQDAIRALSITVDSPCFPPKNYTQSDDNMKLPSSIPHP